MVGGAAYLLEMSQEVATAAHAEYFARIVRDKAVLRSLIHAGTDIIQDASDPTVDAREMLSRAEERVFRILDTKGDTKAKRRPATCCNDCVDPHRRPTRSQARLRRRRNRLHRFRRDDRRPAEFGARDSGGPAQHGQNRAGPEHRRARGARRSMVPTLFVSLEMSSIELGDRLLVGPRARRTAPGCATGISTTTDQDKHRQSRVRVQPAPLFIDDSPSRNMTEIAATARRLKRRENLALIVIDYLQLIEPDNPRDPRQEQVSRISRRLKGPGPRARRPGALPRPAQSAGRSHRATTSRS